MLPAHHGSPMGRPADVAQSSTAVPVEMPAALPALSNPSLESATPRLPLPCPCRPPPPSGPARGGRFPLSVVLTLGPGSLICLVGFLAWGVPFSRLSSTIDPLATSVRAQLLASLAKDLHRRWDTMRNLILQERLRWDVAGQPTDALAVADNHTRLFYPVLAQSTFLVAAPLFTAHGACCHAAVLLRLAAGYFVVRQNCSVRWLMSWDPATQSPTALLGNFPPLSPAECDIAGPVLNTSRLQAFAWGDLFDPTGLGVFLEGNVGLFSPTSGTVIGRAALSMATGYLQEFLQEMLASHATTTGGRLALFEFTGMVVAATHGRSNSTQRLALWEVGDADLEAAAGLLHLGAAGAVGCTPVHQEADLSQGYFLDVEAIEDHQAVDALQWCALLLSPRVNTLAAVDSSRSFATILVCCMTFGVMLLSLILGLLVCRAIRLLVEGMEALRRYEVGAARQTERGGCSWFQELASAQASFHSLVEAIDAFGRYVPQNVVRGLLEGSVRPELGMAERQVALAFMDMEDFTLLCETVPPEEIVALTSEVFEACCSLVVQSQGAVDKFIGDCLMAIWGAPTFVDLPYHGAAQAALDVLRYMRDRAPCVAGRRLALRIGVHGGSCLVGNFGATARWDYTVIGDVVNTAARLEPLNKQFGTHCLVSGAVHDRVARHALQRHLRPLGAVLLLGKSQLVAVYELLSEPPAPPVAAAWVEVVECLEAGRLFEASQALSALGAEPPAQILQQELAEAQANGHQGRFVRTMRCK
eukprot:EG_transcript_2771